MVTLTLDWLGELQFSNGEGSPSIELHSSTPGKTSPPQALAYAVMGCMAMDVVHVVRKGRHRLDAMRVLFEGRRAEHPPRRFETMALHFELTGEIPSSVVERAIALSREKYCSVWHTIRPDVALTTTFEIKSGAGE